MDRPSIVIIVVDALRADCAPFAEESAHLRSLGLTRPDLPAFSELVHSSWRFSQAIACSSYTSACHASLFTGLLPPETGVRAFSVTSLSREVRTLAEILVDAGYATCAMSDQPAFFQPQGLLRGFQVFVTNEDEALAWWDSYTGMPRLLFLHLWDIHQPYGMPVGRAYRSSYPAIIEHWQERLRRKKLAIPDPEEAFYEDPQRYHVGLMQQVWQNASGYKAGVADYIAGLTTFDQGRLKDLGAAMRRRGILDDSLVVITADHGEGRDTPPSNLMKHGNALQDDQIHIPLYMRIPTLTEARPVADQVSQADVTPTLLDVLGLPSERTASRLPYSGRSLLPLLRNGQLPEQPVYAEIWSQSRLAREGIEPTDVEVTAFPRQRILRYPERKYLLAGKHMAISDEMLAAPANVLWQTLYRDLLGRMPSAVEQEMWLPRIQAASPADTGRRRALVRRFEAAGDFRSFPKYAIYDLLRDPLEIKPAGPRLKPADWAAYQPQLDLMLEIDACARQGEPLVSNAADEEVILKRLQGLGYVE